MSARLDIEIFAVAVGLEGTTGAGSVGHHIEIITETDAMYLPVAASILSWNYQGFLAHRNSSSAVLEHGLLFSELALGFRVILLCGEVETNPGPKPSLHFVF